jgi:tRNA A37 N6-isopentenylltransferase MiaA
MRNRGERLRALLIAGPTASGKSALALALAEKLGGTIINADSMQVYRDLRIITARPTPEEEVRVPHLLYGEVDAAENYSAGHWYVDVRAAIAQADAAGRLPIVAGGTGLYFKVLTQGLAAIRRFRRGFGRRSALAWIPRVHCSCTTSWRAGTLPRARASSRRTARASCVRSKWLRRPAGR